MFNLVEHSAVTYTEFWDMPIAVRRFYVAKRLREEDEKKKAVEEANRSVLRK
ncbi:MAG: hypothetical protein ACYDHY_07790 [Acidiferrobacterales bacterium]